MSAVPDPFTMPILTVDGITAGFGSNQVLHGVSFTVPRGEIAGIFGLNGAGKSVTLKTLAGLVPAWSGRITFDGVDVTHLPVEDRVAMGMGHVPQGRQVFPALTVEENLRLGAYTSRKRDRAGYADRLARVLDQFPILAERRTQLAGTMSGGQQASLAVGRALINDPSLILVDEPSAGLAPVIVHELFDILQQVAETGVTMVLVEQNVTFGLRLVRRAHILQTGRIVFDGPVEDLTPDTLAHYLGIGRMLAATTSRALRPVPEPLAATPKRKPAAKRKPTAKKKPTAVKRQPATAKKPAATRRTPGGTTR